MYAFERACTALVGYLYYQYASAIEREGIVGQRFTVETQLRRGNLKRVFKVHWAKPTTFSIELEGRQQWTIWSEGLINKGDLVMKTQERDWHKIWIERLGTNYLPGNAEGGRFTVEVKSDYEVKVTDTDEGRGTLTYHINKA